MFISGGENIFPSEVEKVLETHPAVEQSAVIPVPDDIKGTKPVAFVVLRAGAAGRRGGAEGARPRQRAGLHAPAPGLVPRCAAAGRHQQGGQGALAAWARDGAGAT